MARKNDKNAGDNSSKGDDKEMLDTLFREELDVQKKGAKGPAPSGTDMGEIEAPKEDPESPFEDEFSETAALSTAERRILKIKPGLDDENDTVKSFEAEEDQELEELIDTSPIWRYKDDALEDFGPEPDAKPAKKSHRLRTTLLALLLLALGALSITYFGIVDLHKFIPLSEWKPTPVVKHQVVRKPAIPLIPEEKPPTKPPIPETAAGEPAVLKETPEPVASTAPETPLEKSVAVSGKPEPMPSTQEPAPEKTPPKTASLEEHGPVIQPPKWVEGIYPYSVYLGSFRTPERLQKAVTDYGSMGLSPYWVQVDLGEKGKWFRLFTGFFRTREEAEAFIRENQIPGAYSRHTKYAVLIGTYKSEEELNTERMELRALGCFSYEVKGKNSVFGLFAGAFYQMARAQKQKADLGSKGIQGQVVER
ncbi:MAG: SPOR domain-containing protein [Desulfobacteraceae bacterium]|jgi:cell division septation protein DedD